MPWKNRWHTMTCLMILSMSACKNTGAGDDVQKTLDPTTAEPIYQASAGLCSLKWTLASHGVPIRYGIRESSHCTLPIGNVNPLRDKLIQAVRDDLGDLNSLETFYWGSIRREGSGADISARLMAEAASSPLWDKEKGIPVGGRDKMSETARDLLNTSNAFSELKSTFLRFGFVVQASHVETVVVQPVQDGNPKQEQKGASLLPVDGLVELSLHPPKEHPSSH